MHSSSRSADSEGEVARALELKRALEEFAATGPLRQYYEQQRRQFFELSDPADNIESECVMDWFLHDWFDDRGRNVIYHFLKAHDSIPEEDRRILDEWQDSINSVFEICTAGKKQIQLKEVDSGDGFTVERTGSDSEPKYRKGLFIASRLLPLGERFIFTGPQYILPDRESALEALEMRRSIESLDSAEAREEALRCQRNAFQELFGNHEISVPPDKLTETLKRFQHYVIFERPDPRTSNTPAEKFKSEFGRELKMPEMPDYSAEVSGSGEVTILCDEFDGVVILPEYRKFRRIFESSNPDQDVPEWKDLVWSYIRNPEIPIVAFEAVAEKHPRKVEKIIRTLLDDERFSIKHLYALLLHYKEPVEGLENIEDDQRLWDLLDETARHRNEGASRNTAAKPKAPPCGRKKVAAAHLKATRAAASRSAARKSAREAAGTGSTRKK